MANYINYNMPRTDFSVDPVKDAEEKLRMAMMGGNRGFTVSQPPAVASAPAARSRVLQRATQSVGGALTSNAEQEDLGTGRQMLSRALSQLRNPVDVAALNEFAQQRAQQGDSAMMNALAAQFAGESFQPVQAQYLRRAMAAQDPMKVGNYGTIAGGRFVADPYAQRDAEADAQVRAAMQIMADERANLREENMFARQTAQLEAAERRANAREDASQARLDAKEEEARRKEALRTQARIATADTVLNTVGNAKELLDKTMGGGFVRSRTSQIPGTDAFTLARRIDTIKANIGFDALQAMREASPTGGALGQVAVQEINYLQSTIANLDVGLPDKELQQSLNDVERHYNNIKMIQQGIMPPEYRGNNQNAPQAGQPLSREEFAELEQLRRQFPQGGMQ
jgi:hypothetical protein